MPFPGYGSRLCSLRRLADGGCNPRGLNQSAACLPLIQRKRGHAFLHGKVGGILGRASASGQAFQQLA